MRPDQSRRKAPQPAGIGLPEYDSIFRREGEYWTIAYGGVVIRLRDSKGLHYLARLVHHPAEAFSASALIGAVARLPQTLGDSAAPPRGDTASIERARVAVTKRIKAVIRRIGVVHPSLAYHFNASIKTGAYCSYRPDPERPINGIT